MSRIPIAPDLHCHRVPVFLNLPYPNLYLDSDNPQLMNLTLLSIIHSAL